MIKIRTLYIVLPLTILMAVGCYLKGWIPVSVTFIQNDPAEFR